jgi:hypothetical protein
MRFNVHGRLWNGRDKGELEVGEIFPSTMLTPFPTFLEGEVSGKM